MTTSFSPVAAAGVPSGAMASAAGAGHPAPRAANLLTVLHLVFTVLIIVGALVQLLPVVRRVAPTVHRWNGRFYVFSAPLMATVLEAYLRIRDRGTPGAQLAMTAVLGSATLLTAVGIGAATMIMWLPRVGG